MSREDINHKLSTLSSRVQNNVIVVTSKDVGSSFLLHVSKNPNIKSYIPVIGFRQGALEDRTVARVTTSVQLLGCLIGYAESEMDFIEGVRTSEENQSNLFDKNDWFRGGLYIYAIDFEYALRPNNKLVYDANMSNEHWLINYNKDTAEYHSEIIGKLFYNKITFSASSDTPEESVEMYVEVNKDISFTNKKTLTKGYWKIEGPTARQTRNFKTTKPFKFTEISRSDFYSLKNSSVTLLEYKDPVYKDW